MTIMATDEHGPVLLALVALPVQHTQKFHPANLTPFIIY